MLLYKRWIELCTIQQSHSFRLRIIVRNFSYLFCLYKLIIPLMCICYKLTLVLVDWIEKWDILFAHNNTQLTDVTLYLAQLYLNDMVFISLISSCLHYFANAMLCLYLYYTLWFFYEFIIKHFHLFLILSMMNLLLFAIVATDINKQ